MDRPLIRIGPVGTGAEPPGVQQVPEGQRHICGGAPLPEKNCMRTSQGWELSWRLGWGVTSPGEQLLSPGAVSWYPRMLVLGFGYRLLIYLLVQCPIVLDLLRKLLLILGSSSGWCQSLGCPTERFSQVSWWRLEPPDWGTLNSNQPASDPKGHVESPVALIMISALQPHNGPHCHVSQMPQCSLPSRFRSSILLVKRLLDYASITLGLSLCSSKFRLLGKGWCIPVCLSTVGWWDTRQ